MSQFTIAVTSLVIELFIIGMCALRNTGALRALLLVQTAYWTISYVVRPIVVAIFQPAGVYGDSLADLRLMSAGYEKSYGAILVPVTWGLGAYALIVLIFTLLRGGKRVRASLDQRRLTPLFTSVLVIGSLARVIELTPAANPISGLLVWFASLGAIGLLVYFRCQSRVRTYIVLVVIFLLQLSWSILTTSKTPLLAALVAVFVRVVLSGNLRKSILGFGTTLLAGLLVFPALQKIKLAGNDVLNLASVDSTYPETIQPILPILRRLDMVSAMTDAYLAGPGSWMNAAQYLSQAWTALLPNLFGVMEKTNAGVLWAQEVRAQTLVGANTEVSLADGFIAEGYLLAGPIGILAEALFLFSVLLLVVRGLHSHSVFFVSWSVLMISYPVLYERGSLGIIEVGSRAVVVAMLALVVSFILRAVGFDLGGNVRMSRAKDGGVRDADSDRSRASMARASVS